VAESHGALYPLRWLILATVLIGTVTGTLGNSMPNVALPTIRSYFGVDISSAVWLITIYILLFSVPMPLFGRLGDLYGYKRIYMVGLGIFALASLGAGLAPSFGALLGFRALQGIANAPTLPAVMAIAARVFPEEERGRAMGIWALTNSAAHGVGPALSGILTHYLGWPAIFYFNVPLSLLGLFLIWRVVPKDGQGKREPFDFVGAFTFTLAMLIFMFNLTQGAKSGWLSGWRLLLWTLCLLLFAGFLTAERKATNPFVDLRIFQSRGYTGAMSVASLQALSQFGLLLIMPLFLSEVRGYRADQTGILVAPLAITMAVVAPMAGGLADRFGCRRSCFAGMGFIALGGLALIPLGMKTPAWYVVACLVTVGIGMGLIQSPSAAAVTQVVAPSRLGVGLGIFNMFRFVSGTLGATIFGVVLGGLSTGPTPELFAFRVDFGLVALAAIMGAVFAASLPGPAEKVGGYWEGDSDDR